MDRFKKYLIGFTLCVMLAIVIAVTTMIIVEKDNSTDEKEQEQEQNDIIAEYQKIIQPAMLSDNVSTKFTIEDGEQKAELRYAISGINSLVSYYSNTGDSELLIELWNNMEQYYMRTVIDGDENSYRVEVIEDTRDEMNSYIYSYYIMAMSYLGVASKERIISFEQVDDLTYAATSELEDTTYGLRFVLDDGVLKSIYMFEDLYEDRAVSIQFDEFRVTDQSDYENTEETCNVDFVGEMFNYSTEQ